MSVKELDSLLSVLIEKKRKMEQEEAETYMQILHDFLHCLRKKKLEELSQVLEIVFVFMGFYRLISHIHLHAKLHIYYQHFWV